MRLDRTTFRAFLAAESGGAALEFAIVAAGVGLALSATLFVVRGRMLEQFGAIETALKQQNNLQH